MIDSYFCIFLMVILIWLSGRFVVNIIGLGLECNYITMAVGLSIISFLVDLLYFRIKLSMSFISVIFLLSMTILFIIQFKQIEKKELFIPGFMIIAIIVLSIPGLIHGDQYYVYRGNFWDQNIYLSEALTSIKYSWREIKGIEYSIGNDIYDFGNTLLHNDRPTVALVFALALLGKKGDFFALSYLYHCMYIAMIFPPMYSITAKIFNNNTYTKKAILCSFIIPLLYICGFWGQIQYDINAWSQLSTIGLFIANTYINLVLYEDFEKNSEVEGYICNYKILVLINIIMLGGFLLYVENWTIQYVLISLSILLLFVIQKKKISIKQILAYLSIPVSSFIVGALACPQIIKFLYSQITGTVGGIVDYGNYWTDWMYGFWSVDNIAQSAKIPAFVLSVFGMPQYVTKWGSGAIVVYTWMLFMFFVFVLLCYRIICSVIDLKKCNSLYEKFIICLFIVSLFMGIAIWYKVRAYGFVKYIIYVSPYSWIYVCYPIGLISDAKFKTKKSLLCVLATLVLLSGVSFGGFRVIDTIKNNNANGYNREYPSDQDPGLKASHRFNFDIKKLGNVNIIQLEEEFPFYLNYMKMKVLYADKEYYCEENNTLRENEYIKMEKPQKIDMEVHLEENSKGQLEPVYILR